MKYKIFVASESDILQYYVNEDIEQGWRPLGGVSLSIVILPNNRYPTYRFAQAMIHTTPPPADDAKTG